jgi:hypothetical protein
MLLHPSNTCFFIVTQFFAAAYVIAATDSITNNLILANVPRYVPEVNPQAVISAGAGNLEEAFQGATLRGIRQAYNVGLRGAWALIIALFCVSFFCAFIPKWPGRIVSDATKEEEQQGSEKDETEAI